MRLFRLKHDDKNYVVLAHEYTEPIAVGEEYVLLLWGECSLNRCGSEGESKEINEGMKPEPGVITVMKNINRFCWKVFTKIEVDEEGYSKFYATLNNDLDVVTYWRADQGCKPLYKQNHYVCALQGTPKYNHADCTPMFICSSDVELAKELGIVKEETLYQVELNAIDWFLESDWVITGGNYEQFM